MFCTYFITQVFCWKFYTLLAYPHFYGIFWYSVWGYFDVNGVERRGKILCLKRNNFGILMYFFFLFKFFNNVKVFGSGPGASKLFQKSYRLSSPEISLRTTTFQGWSYIWGGRDTNCPEKSRLPWLSKISKWRRKDSTKSKRIMSGLLNWIYMLQDTVKHS